MDDINLEATGSGEVTKAWTRLLGSAGAEWAKAITRGSEGSIYIAGTTNSDLDGETNNGGSDTYLTKYDANGRKIWTQLIGQRAADSAAALTTGSDGSIYLAGTTFGDLNGEESSGIGSSADVYLAKYDPNGSEQWTRILYTNHADSPEALTTGSDGSIYVAGTTYGDLDGGVQLGHGDAFLTKYDPDGTKHWTRQFGTTGLNSASALTTGSDGSIYVAGATRETYTADIDAYLTKYDSDGIEYWTKQLGTPSTDVASALATDSNGSIYIAGSTRGNLDGNSNVGNSAAFLAKYDPDGTKNWTQLLSARSEYPWALTTGIEDSIYIAGYTHGDLDGVKNSGDYDAFLTKYRPDGTKSWTELLGTTSFEQADALASGSDGSIYIAGSTQGDLGGETNSGGSDSFLVKIIDEEVKDSTVFISDITINEGEPWSLILTNNTNFDTGFNLHYLDSSTASHYTNDQHPGEDFNVTSASGALEAGEEERWGPFNDIRIDNVAEDEEQIHWKLSANNTSKDIGVVTIKDTTPSFFEVIDTTVAPGEESEIVIRRTGDLSRAETVVATTWQGPMGLNHQSDFKEGESLLSFKFIAPLLAEGETSKELQIGLFNQTHMPALLTPGVIMISNEIDNAVAFNYNLWGIDKNFMGQVSPPQKEVKKQIAVLGDSVDHSARYDLNITADILNDYMIEGADITIGFDAQLFNSINASDVTIGTEFPIANAVQINNDLGTIRLAGATLSQLTQNGDDISGDTILASISLDFDEAALATIEKNTDGSLKTNPLAFSIDANLDETVFSKLLADGSGFENRDIQTLRDLGGTISVDGQDVTLYEAKINLEQQGDGLVLGTQRVIGSDASFTNLIRKGDTLSTSATWLNVGNATANNIQVQSINNANASLAGSTLSKTSLNSGSFIDGVFVQDGREDLTLFADIHITGDAGNVLDLSDGILSIKADGSEVFSNTNAGSSNLITYQGDLNYDGRVSMKDLAYLNAGAARQKPSHLDAVPNQEDQNNDGIIDASVARDVDADFSGKIDLADLSVLDQDWGKSLHTGDKLFQGSAEVSWSELDNQGESSTWDNDSFKDQNAIEAEAGYIGSLESPTSNGVIGTDGNTSANDNDITGTELQDPFPA